MEVDKEAMVDRATMADKEEGTTEAGQEAATEASRALLVVVEEMAATVAKIRALSLTGTRRPSSLAGLTKKCRTAK